MELDGESHRPVDDDMMQAPRWDHLVLIGRHGAYIVGPILEHEAERTRFDDEPSPDTCRDRVCGAKAGWCCAFVERRCHALERKSLGKLHVGRHLATVARSAW